MMGVAKGAVATAITKPHTIVTVSTLLPAPRCIDRKPAQDVCTYHIVICLTPNLLLSGISSRAVKLVCMFPSAVYDPLVVIDISKLYRTSECFSTSYCLITTTVFVSMCFVPFFVTFCIEQANKKKTVTFTDLLFKISSVLLICGYSLLRLVRN